jgi:hypothetical protein
MSPCLLRHVCVNVESVKRPIPVAAAMSASGRVRRGSRKARICQDGQYRQRAHAKQITSVFTVLAADQSAAGPVALAVVSAASRRLATPGPRARHAWAISAEPASRREIVPWRQLRRLDLLPCATDT